MKSTIRKFLTLTGLALPLALQAQDYTLDWFSMPAGGGRGSSEGRYSLVAIIGQHAAPAAGAGPYSLMTGALVTLEPIPQQDQPLLEISRTGTTIRVGWERFSDNWVLESSPGLGAVARWTEVPAATYQTTETHSFIDLTRSPEIQVYRLRRVGDR